MSARERFHGIILVADDNEANRELLASLLGQEGYQVISVADGRQALAQVSSDSIDVALLDVVMPGKSGFEVCQAIKSKPETCLIPVVLLTSLTSDDDRIHGIISAPNDVLPNPMTTPDLLT